MNKTPIILDCDPGHDDAIAILLAGSNPSIELLGITVTCGNQTLPKTSRNALNLVQYLDIDVPVCLGVEEPLVRPVRVAPEIHGETGLDGFDFPPLIRQADPRHAVDFMIETLLNSTRKITMVTTGPMTNLALAMRKEPRIKQHIKEIVFMGGSYTYGNVTPAAEFNILADPEAAHIIFTSGLPLKMFGLDVTRQVLVLPEIIERMARLHNKASELFEKLMVVYNVNQKRVFGLDGGPLHDPLTIAYLIDPSVVTLTNMHCEIDISHGPSGGRTNCDVLNYGKKSGNTLVATAIDVEKFWTIIETGLQRYKN
ncbi:nucleoside hydrolase [Candidatus Xianfuyuplasma coldseepsis]|uniref:Nucleoside hydrolase n=1 Tax=Candidatus Xianfuyuplasma coldseepsis TaxID=2782163 RepID=A0A7L7KQN1_9MOLU|nr:nucleoside hydrolase [Xianfuyuplasma coldseepsis]QMS84254.1 nucleoside hydrolase [Xianfuyuplasma coldseepsis]